MAQSIEINTKYGSLIEVESVKCHSCGFTEECTPPYISRVRDRHQGRRLCGLCVETVKDEVLRSDRLISMEEALNRHINFCKKIQSSTQSKTEHPISVLGRILRRSLDSPRTIWSNSSRNIRSNSSRNMSDIEKINGSQLIRYESCFSALSR